MEKKFDALALFKGLQLDLPMSSHNNGFFSDAKNIRIIPTDSKDKLAVTNEKGTLLKNLSAPINGKYLGHCVISKYLVVFTKYDGNPSIPPGQDNGAGDYIYVVNSDSFTTTVIAHGDFNFSIDHSIETLGVYENNLAIKVYFVDGLNQPRVINIAKQLEEGAITDGTKLDFIQELQLNEVVTVERTTVSTGLFAPGVIQYAFSYYNKFGQETNIFYTTPLQYVSNSDRGADPDKTVSNSFTITINNVDTSFEYLRIYSVHRSQLNGTPAVKIVDDILIEDFVESRVITYTDNGMIGLIIDPTRLLYVGGESIIAGTMTSKNNTLFLGDIVKMRSSLREGDNSITSRLDGNNFSFSTDTLRLSLPTLIYSDFYKYTSFISKNGNGFKYGEHYLLGIQFQHKNGRWSDPIELFKYTVGTEKTQNELTHEYEYIEVSPITPSLTITPTTSSLNKLIIDGYLGDEEASSYVVSNLILEIINLDYVNYRPVVVFPTIKDRLILAQGILCPTLQKRKFKNNAWYKEDIDYYSSWYTRLNLPTYKTWNISGYNEIDSTPTYTEDSLDIDSINKNYIDQDLPYKGVIPECRHNKSVSLKYSVEIQSDLGFIDNNRMSRYFVQQNVADLYSPDLLFDNDLLTLETENLRFRVIGYSLFRSNSANIDITATAPISSSGGPLSDFGVSSSYLEQSSSTSADNVEDNLAGARTLVNGPFYYDCIVDDFRSTKDDEKDDVTKTRFMSARHKDGDDWKDYPPVYFNIYPWHNSKSLNNDTLRPSDDSKRTALLKTKIISNLKFSDLIMYFGSYGEDAIEYDCPDIKMYNQFSLIEKFKINTDYTINNTTGKITVNKKDTHIYNGNVNTLEVALEPFNIKVRTNSSEYKLWWNTNLVYIGGSTKVGDFITSLVESYESAAIKYRTAPHYIVALNYIKKDNKWYEGLLPIIDLPESEVVIGDDTPISTEIQCVALGDRYENYLLGYRRDWDPDVITKLKNMGADQLYYESDFALIFKKRSEPKYTVINEPESIPVSGDVYLLWFNSYFLAYFDLIYLDEVINMDCIYSYNDGQTTKYYSINEWKFVVSRNSSEIIDHPNSDLPLSWVRLKTKLIQLIGTKAGNTYSIYYFKERITSGDDSDISIDLESNTARVYETHEVATPLYNDVVTKKPISTHTKDITTNTRFINAVDYPYLCLGEIFRKEEDISNAFNLYLDRLWIPAGEPKRLDVLNTLGKHYIHLEYIYGDTWFQRYDCLKTYPYDDEDTNQLVDIVSFMCETRVNIDGRYDRNRALINNCDMSPRNFNLINNVYSQPNNYFNYRVYPDWYYKLTDYPNTVTWSLTKHNGEEVDNWCNVTLANTLDLDGSYGRINKLLTHRSLIMSFLDKAISSINFDERVQVTPSDGTPIEITNSGKVSGYTYLNTHIGVTNKWTIVQDNYNVYFIDSISKSLYSFGELLLEVSSNKYMNSWYLTINSLNPWMPSTFTTKQFYDLKHLDLYTVTSSNCLSFSNVLTNFSSFFDYDSTPAMFNIGDKFYALRNIKIEGREGTGDRVELYEMFGGNYNSFFGTKKNFYIEFISNADAASDKIFTNLEYLADFDLNVDGVMDNPNSEITFDTIQVSNEYLDSGIQNLTHLLVNQPTNQKKKFRTWRILLPTNYGNSLERIRNNWAKIKLTSLAGDTHSSLNYKMTLHSLLTEYYI